MDTEAQVTIVPTSFADCALPALPAPQPSSLPLAPVSACSGQPMFTTYCTPILLANVKFPLLHADFLRCHYLLVDISSKCLVHAHKFDYLPCSITIFLPAPCSLPDLDSCLGSLVTSWISPALLPLPTCLDIASTLNSHHWPLNFPQPHVTHQALCCTGQVCCNA